ncbi:unnamed protein product [Amoebophrya sp. A25]|nr:unnamed protein product [Amoebophrya sp. A25]|eukprot:GSA25T00023700001.1
MRGAKGATTSTATKSKALGGGGSFSLVLQFNYLADNAVYRVVFDAWRRAFSPESIWVACPFSKDDKHTATAKGEPGSASVKWLTYQSDRGYVSPYRNLAKVIAKSPKSKRFLYVHDDALLVRSVQFGEPNKGQPAVDGFFVGSFSLVPTARLHSNGTTQAHHMDRWPFRDGRPVWAWWDGCVRSLASVLRDKGFLELFASRLGSFGSSDVSSSGVGHSASIYLDIFLGQADMLFAELRGEKLRSDFLSFLQLLARSGVFLECAIPTAIGFVQRLHKIEHVQVKLCTSWAADRGTEAMLDNCPQEARAYHPYKVGTASGEGANVTERLDTWRKKFDEMAAGIL